MDLDRLTAYLKINKPELLADGDLTARLIPGGRSNLTYELGTSWVLRRPPLGHVLATAHDMAREHRVLSGLADSPVPVPRPLLLCADPDVLGAPFYVMERVAGTVHRSPGAVRAALGEPGAEALADDLVRVLTALHGLAPAQYGLADFGRPEGFLERQVRRWRGQLDASRSRPVEGIDELADRLGRLVPPTQRHSIVHGDYRLDNCLVGADGRVAAVLDWEMSTLGDPLTDLGLLRVYWSIGAGIVASPAPGSDAAGDSPLVPPERMIAGYADSSDLDLEPLPWYVAFGYFKLAVILEGIHYRYTRGKTVGAGFETVGAAVAPLVAAGLAALDRDGMEG
ncbi:MAG TPA: phosphotransferase family protein [Micromonosporaceae bacterium]|nr:phosphotransferase family protein [Micromonosporaceae bacterium]